MFSSSNQASVLLLFYSRPEATAALFDPTSIRKMFRGTFAFLPIFFPFLISQADLALCVLLAKLSRCAGVGFDFFFFLFFYGSRQISMGKGVFVCVCADAF
ncbi:hypothetical protein J3E72DRAFT_10010 [Bipolaris maydis]|nr:hypothetical protein J3E72DRAFT_10010 [Bipolaris maydis]KAJ6278741.1 hypothetical protein J3E71DRAFT_11187 [Bipolaris maydis]